MADQSTVRRVALALPGVKEKSNYFSFHVEDKGKERNLCWVWLERVHPKKARVPNPGFLGVRVANQLEKEALLAADPVKFFTEPHYNGYPAVLVRLAEVSESDLQKLLSDAWDCMAPRALREGGAPSTVAPKAAAKTSSSTPKTVKRKPEAKKAAPAANKKPSAKKLAPAKQAKPAKPAKKPAAKKLSRRRGSA